MSFPATDQLGTVRQLPNSGADSGFSVGYGAITTHATPNVIWSIAGPTSGVARLRKLRFRLQGSTTVVALVASLQKMSTLSVGTPATAIVPVAKDSSQSITTATCVVKAYSADPTASGTNTIFSTEAFSTGVITASTGQADTVIEWTWGGRGDPPQALRTGEFIGLTLNGGTLPSGTPLFSVSAEWDEATA